ncbi:GNAT family N-acetyltransferase [Microbacterium sp. MYb62]|uniref:GNAT family N-acetyltransferase n=1 Tax=Microbacterium sp. MYb62 TaxID=1848690 RepID=UPI000CFD2639|nr:GNAT family N-acetyltransferase [Microbacterium sp. MYb62]PRB13277.1 GNAT family N-acetyltransferase [Microbacterium sp. MYb62]
MSEATIRAARPDDQAELTALWAAAFTPPLAPDQWLIDHERLAHTRVAEDDAGLCGSIYGLPKRLREDDGGIAEVHAIGSVAVAERARGHGLARRLVTATLQTAPDADWALLFTGTPEVYRSSGFESFSMARTLAGPWHAPGAAAAAAADRVERESVGLGSFRPLREVYERSRAGRVVLAPVRGDRDTAMAEVRMTGATLYRRTEGSTVIGYAITERRGDVGMLLESAVLPGVEGDAEGARDDLLAAIAVDWASAGVTSCDLAVPALPEEDLALRSFAPEAVRQADRTGMIRPLRREARLHGIRHLTAGDYF